MNTGYALAWLVIVVFGLGAAALTFLAANAWRYSHALRWPLAALVLALALAPHRFDGEHAAPALVVAVFRWLFEDYADPLPAAQTAGAAAAAVLAASVVAAAVLGVARSRLGAIIARKRPPRSTRRTRRRRRSATRN